jgi:DNA modification methylase
MDIIKITCEAKEYINIDKLKDFQGDLKDISRSELDKLKRSIKKYGFSFPVFVWKDNILDGHQRVAATRELIKEGCAIDDLPIVRIQAKDKKEAGEKLLMLNSQYAKMTQHGVESFLDGMGINATDIFGMVEIPGIDFDNIFFSEEGFDESDDTPDVKNEAKAKLGDIYKLGKHKIMCGDCTKDETVRKLMDGNKADMVFTDPPYGGVSYTDKNDFLNKCISGTGHKAIIGDDLRGENLKIMLQGAFNNIATYSRSGAVVYVAYAHINSSEFREAMVEAGIHISQTLIWVKNRAVLSRNDYNWKHEPILYGWVEGAAHYFKQDFTQTTVFDGEISIEEMEKDELLKFLKEILSEQQETVIREDILNKNDLHPTMKPVPLVTKLILNSTKPNCAQIIFDPFLGSGTTLIAATKINRICYGMEIDPHYIDVIIQRWEDYTGQKAVLIKE